MMNRLNEGETLEDLQCDGLRMIQGKNLFRFGEDSVLLAHFVVSSLMKSREARRTVMDLGCNCGSISLLLSRKLPNATIIGVEITSKAAEIFKRNIVLNGLDDRVSCIHEDWNHLQTLLPACCMDTIVCNPPYAIPDYKKKKLSMDKDAREMTDLRIAREEIHSTLDQLMATCHHLLKAGGRAFYIYRADRMVDVLESMRRHRIEPRRLRIILPFIDKAPVSFLVMGQKLGKPGGFVAEKPLILFDSPSGYTAEVAAMYGKCPPLTEDELYRDVERV